MRSTHLKRGFSLIEIILALLVIAVGITAMLGLLGSSLGSSSKARADIHIVSFADMVLNYFHSQTEWNKIPTMGPVSLPDYYGNTVELAQNTTAQFTLSEQGDADQDAIGSFTVTYQLNIDQDEESPNVKRIHLEVWQGLSTNSPSRRFFTEVYNWADK
jgi:prepilin-type N-terminal cleavage/methylation domain-containing protein